MTILTTEWVIEAAREVVRAGRAWDGHDLEGQGVLMASVDELAEALKDDGWAGEA